MDKNKISNDFKHILKDLRTKKGLSQDEFAKELGISKGAVSYYETGQRVPDIVVLSAIADYFEVSTDYLLGRTETKSINEDVQIACKVTGLSETSVFLLSEVIQDMQVDIGSIGDLKPVDIKNWLIIDVFPEMCLDIYQMLVYIFVSTTDNNTKEMLNDYLYGAIARSTDKCKYKIDRYIQNFAQINGIETYKSIMESGTNFSFDFYKDWKAGD